VRPGDGMRHDLSGSDDPAGAVQSLGRSLPSTALDVADARRPWLQKVAVGPSWQRLRSDRDLSQLVSIETETANVTSLVEFGRCREGDPNAPNVW